MKLKHINQICLAFTIILSIFLNIETFAGITIDANFENGYIGKYEIKEPDTINIGPVFLLKT